MKQLLVFLFQVLIFQTSIAQPESTTTAPMNEKRPTIFQSLKHPEAVKLTLDADFVLVNAKKKSAQYVPGMLGTADGKTFKVQIRSRGRFRRMKASIPPLKIEMEKASLIEAGLDTLDELKLAMPVLEGKAGDDLIVREYTAYKLLEKAMPHTHHAQLVSLEIRDVNAEKPSQKTILALLIEDEEEMAQRLDAQLVGEVYGVPADSFLLDHVALAIMFEYMIGNMDWDLSMMRNLRGVRFQTDGKIAALPYDFDFAGLVSAPYSAPSKESGKKTVRERFLMAYDIPEANLLEAVRKLKALERDFYKICNASYVPKPVAKDMTDFLKSFFDEVREDEKAPWRKK